MNRRRWILLLVVANVIIAAAGAAMWWRLIGEWNAANEELNQEIERSGRR